MASTEETPCILLNPSDARAPYRDAPPTLATTQTLPDPSSLKTHPRSEQKGHENASLFFVGTATTILEWGGVRIMTDPNFLHAGDHVHLGPGVTATRKTNPAVDLHDLPRIDLCLVSHYHADHFDQKVEASLRRDLPIITTPHAKTALTTKSPESDHFTAITALEAWSTCLVSIPSTSTGEQDKASNNAEKAIKVTATPGKHVPPGPAGLLEKANDLLGAVPPTNGWMLELGHSDSNGGVKPGYTIYISGDTLMISELALIPEKFPHVDLMLVHLGGTTIPGPHAPLLMVTMDAKEGVQLVRLIKPDVTIPIHYDDYDIFLSPLEDFKQEMSEAGLDPNVVYLDRGEAYSFTVAVRD